MRVSINVINGTRCRRQRAVQDSGYALGLTLKNRVDEKTTTVVRCLTVFCLICASCVLGTVSSRADEKQKLKALRSSDFEQRLHTRDEFINDRADLVEALKKIIKSDKSKKTDDLISSPKHMAIILAGELRVEQCVPQLFEELDFEVEVTTGGYAATNSLLNRFPAVKSLIQIKTFDVVTRALAFLSDADKHEEQRRLCVYILHSVAGPKRAEQLLSSEAAGAQDSARKKAILEALRHLGSLIGKS